MITFLSNVSKRYYKDNTLTSVSNKLHERIRLDPIDYHYIALQEIGSSLNPGNVSVPSTKHSLIYFEYDFESCSIINSYLFIALSGLEALNLKYFKVLNELFSSAYELVKE